MASESVATPQLILGDETLGRIKDALSWAIMAKHELDEVTLCIKQAAASGWPAAALVEAEMLPRPVDLDLYEAAELVMLVGMQQRHAVEREAQA